MNNRLFPRMCLVIPLIISFLFMPVNKVNAAGYSSDADYWRWWYIEHQTDAITDGQGASAENIENTDSGQTAGTVIYNQSGVTRGDFIDYVEEQYNQAEGYLQKGVDYYVDAVNHVYDSTVTAATKASYETQKAVREVVDSTGKTIVDVSGSDFWHSAYNGLFNGNGYNDQYTSVNGNNYDGTSGGYTYNIEYLGQYNWSVQNPVENPIFIQQFYNSTSNGIGYYPAFFKLTCNGTTYYFQSSSYYNRQDYLSSLDSCEIINNGTALQFTFSRVSGGQERITFNFKNITNNTITQGNTSVKQPKQVGFIQYNGNRIPVYTDPSQNPFTVNDDGTVDYNGTNYHIYVDPDEISPDGWLKILEFIDNEDQTENPYNPQGQPWNTQNDGSILGGFFSNLISDIGNLFGGLIDKLKEIVDKIANFFNNFIDSIVNAIKKFIELFIGNIDLDAMTDLDITNPFSMVQDCYDLLLELLGVNTT